ncbi:hypothetical protein [Polaromonas sp.]|uniref:hypothetical protein n=1 Tax=Polaromonas sp. TaxID=1869339 RepID=UPI00352A5CB8
MASLHRTRGKPVFNKTRPAQRHVLPKVAPGWPHGTLMQGVFRGGELRFFVVKRNKPRGIVRIKVSKKQQKVLLPVSSDRGLQACPRKILPSSARD